MSIYDEIAAERARAAALHGDQPTGGPAANDLLRLTILLEEVGEAVDEFFEAKFRAGGQLPSNLSIMLAHAVAAGQLAKAYNETPARQVMPLDVDLARLRAELVQVAAMSAEWAAAIPALRGDDDGGAA